MAIGQGLQAAGRALWQHKHKWSPHVGRGAITGASLGAGIGGVHGLATSGISGMFSGVAGGALRGGFAGGAVGFGGAFAPRNQTLTSTAGRELGVSRPAPVGRGASGLISRNTEGHLQFGTRQGPIMGAFDNIGSVTSGKPLSNVKLRAKTPVMTNNYKAAQAQSRVMPGYDRDW